MLAEVRGKFPAVIFLIFNYNGCKVIVQGGLGIDPIGVKQVFDDHERSQA